MPSSKHTERPSFAASATRFFALILLPIVLITLLLLHLRPALSNLPTLPSLRSSSPSWPPVLPPPSTHLPHRPNWAERMALPFCREMVENPLPFTPCFPDTRTQRCPRDGSLRMISRHDQDWYLYTNHFSRLRRRGVYLDVAANNATAYSNSYFMDGCLGWEGVCVEANPVYHPEITEKRTCRLIPTCVSNQEGEKVQFLAAHQMGGIKKTNKAIRPNGFQDGFNLTGTLSLTCTTLDTVLTESKVDVVDYLSLDVEGHELKVMYGIDWNKTRFNVITVEIGSNTLLAIERFLYRRGYVRHYPLLDGKRVPDLHFADAVFLHENVTWGKPI